ALREPGHHECCAKVMCEPLPGRREGADGEGGEHSRSLARARTRQRARRRRHRAGGPRGRGGRGRERTDRPIQWKGNGISRELKPRLVSANAQAQTLHAEDEACPPLPCWPILTLIWARPRGTSLVTYSPMRSRVV